MIRNNSTRPPRRWIVHFLLRVTVTIPLSAVQRTPIHRSITAPPGHMSGSSLSSPMSVLLGSGHRAICDSSISQ